MGQLTIFTKTLKSLFVDEDENFFGFYFTVYKYAQNENDCWSSFNVMQLLMETLVFCV